MTEENEVEEDLEPEEETTKEDNPDLLKEEKKRILVMIAALVFIAAFSIFIGYLIGMDHICKNEGGFLSKDESRNFICRNKLEMGRVCFDVDEWKRISDNVINTPFANNNAKYLVNDSSEHYSFIE